MPVSDLHADYSRYADEWKRTEAATIGSPALRRDNELFLPSPYVGDDVELYAQYCARAYYVNYTGRTEKVLQGMVFRKPATQVVPKKMQHFLEDMDGNGESIAQIAKTALFQRLRKDRFLFLTDYSGVSEGMTEAQEKAAGLRPICATYKAESLVNWKWGSCSGKRQLVLAVLKECKDISEDEFGHDTEDQYRVLRLRDGYYTQQLYNDKDEPVTEEWYPLAKGKKLDYIPLRGVRPLEVAALQPVAEVNLALYRNTAAFEDLVAIMGSPILHIDTGLTTVEDWKRHNKQKVKVGMRTGVITKNGNVSFAQAAERPLIRTAKEDKVEELAAIGASIVTRGGQAETAEAARLKAGSETSQLDSMVGDLSEDLEGVLEDMARFMGLNPDEVNYALNTDFFDTALTAGDLSAIVQGAILYGDDAALEMIRKGRIELPTDKDNATLMLEAASVDRGGFDGL
ncbi:MAG TPA: DUF4055 domain-containing protein [Pseudomonadales bacterium]|nr:DUF4055 domain-containing protein [Pseudomonadales bacterium]